MCVCVCFRVLLSCFGPVQVWHKDLFLTDDFLGHVTIPLKDVAVQSWDDDDDAPAPGEGSLAIRTLDSNMLNLLLAFLYHAHLVFLWRVLLSTVCSLFTS